MGGIVIDIWEKSNFFGSIGSLKCTKNAIFLQGGQNLPPLPLVGLIKKSNDPNCKYNFHLNQSIHQLNIKVGLIGL